MAEFSIKSLQALLKDATTDWQPDGCVPCNYVRLNGMNDELARVDRWCGGFQDVHRPTFIGWRVSVGNVSSSGLVEVSPYIDLDNKLEDGVDAAISIAKQRADDALQDLRGR